MSLKTKVNTLTASFKEAVDKYKKDKAALQESKMYSADYIASEIGKLDTALNTLVADSNAMLQTIFQESIDEIKSNKAGGSDFESKLSNALTFINALGDRLTDETAFALVQPFFGDYQTMHRLSMVLAGKQGIPATMLAVSGYDNAIKLLQNIRTKYRGMFNSFRNDAGMLGLVTNQYLMTEIDAYEAYIARLHEYLSASADDAEKVVANHQTFNLGLGESADNTSVVTVGGNSEPNQGV